MKSCARLLALGGVVGPVAFVGAWTLAGDRTTGYSFVNNAISELAAVDAATRGLMTTGFIVDGFGLVAFGLALREVLDGRAWIAAVVTGAATMGVAAAPLGGWAGDNTHAAFAGLGYASIAVLPLLVAPQLARGVKIGWARASVGVGVLSAAALVASTIGPAHGAWQRLGLTVGDAWIVSAASVIALGGLKSPLVDRGAKRKRARQ